MLDWEGNMQPKKDRQHWIVLDDVEDDTNMVASLSITPLEQEAIDIHLIEDDERLDEMGISFISRPGNHVSSTLGSISNTLVDLDLSSHMCEKAHDGRIAASIGSTNTLQSRYISNSVLKNPYSRFGLISSYADQFNSWCSPMLRCLFTCIFHNL